MALIKDVAREAGVSPTTVSSVINGLNCVKPTTREKVLKAIDSLGYSPNIAARELVTRKKQNIGLILMTYESYTSRRSTPDGGEELMYEEYISGIAQIIAGSGYGLLIEYFCYVPGSQEIPRIIKENRVAGVIVAGSIYTDSFIELIKQETDAVVTIGCHSQLADFVVNDYMESMIAAVRYLVSCGHRRIAYLSGDPMTYAYPLKRLGYKMGLEEAGIAYDGSLVLPCRYQVIEGYEAARTLHALPSGTGPTAILCAGDLLAVGALHFFYENGIRVPQDYSIMGYENTNLAIYVTPRLSTVDWHKNVMNEKACRLLLDRLKDPGLKRTGVVVPCEIKVRESVLCLK